MLSALIYVLTAVEVISSLLLIGVILLQRTKQQGMGLSFGGAMGESLFGPQVGNVLTRATVILAVVFLLNTTVLALLGTSRRRATSVTETSPVSVPAAVPSPMQPGGVPAEPIPAPMEQPVPAPETAE